ncbi:MAG: cytochrome c biogenesis protein CcdA, partial [bacterium]
MEVSPLHRATFALALLWCISGSAFCFEEPPKPEDIVSTKTHVSYDAVHPGMPFQIAVVCRLLEGWHINSSRPTDPMFVATELAFDLPEDLEIRKMSFPKGVLKKFSFSDKKLSVYEDEFTIVAEMLLSGTAVPGERTLEGTLHYQACNDMMCLEPVEKSLKLRLRIVDQSIPIMRSELGVFAAEKDRSDTGLRLENRGIAVAFLVIFVGGLALNLTPCIYPMIPITISYFGGQSRGSHGRLLILGIAYVIGIAITYSVLGLIAALTGSLLGAAMQNPVVLLFVVLVLIALALAMFDVFTLAMPARLNRFAGSGRGGVLGSLVMGLTLGVVVAPCVGPFVLGLLTYVGKQGNPLLGFWMLFTLAIGMGLPLVVLGVLSGSISKLPRSGEWMVWVKKVFGFILFGMAVYFLRSMIPGWVYWMGMAA